MENTALFSLQARLIRQMQAVAGQTLCYASEVSEGYCKGGENASLCTSRRVGKMCR